MSQPLFLKQLDGKIIPKNGQIPNPNTNKRTVTNILNPISRNRRTVTGMIARFEKM